MGILENTKFEVVGYLEAVHPGQETPVYECSTCGAAVTDKDRHQQFHTINPLGFV